MLKLFCNIPCCKTDFMVNFLCFKIIIIMQLQDDDDGDAILVHNLWVFKPYDTKFDTLVIISYNLNISKYISN